MFIAKCRAGNPELVADPTAEKRCGKCSQTLHPTRFTKDVHTKDGLRRICRSCASERYKTKNPASSNPQNPVGPPKVRATRI